MSHLPFTLLAYFLNSIAVLIDKFMITKEISDPLVYVFYFSVFSLLAILILPFTHIPPLGVFILASLSTLLWTSGAYCMLSALKVGQASRVIPVIGTLTPTLLFFQALSTNSIIGQQVMAVLALISGLVFLTLPDIKLGNIDQSKVLKVEVPMEIIASILFASSYLILREAYLRESFLTVFAWSRVILIPVGIVLVALPLTRKIVLAHVKSKNTGSGIFSRTTWLFLGGQAAGGSSELLLTFSISLATPALVNSLQGVQYVFLFFATLLLAKKFPQVFTEKFSTPNLVSKAGGIFLIGGGLYLLAFTS